MYKVNSPSGFYRKRAMSDQSSKPGNKNIYNAPLEKAFSHISTPFEDFIHDEAMSGLVLMVCTIIALLAANSFLAHTYENILHAPVAVSIGGWELKHSIHHWINDGLMAMFFFVVGLEIKREARVGELSDLRQALLPITAAFGGMIVPALIYFSITAGTDNTNGWGIPMATDIAFAVGALVMLGNRIPKTLLTFLVALAIVDDLGAVVVIAVFYTENIAFGALGIALLIFGMLWMLNLAGIRNPLPYFLLGGLMWLAMLYSGVHATLAGVLTALTIPSKPKYDPLFFSGRVRKLMDRFDASHKPEISIIKNEQQRAILQTLENVTFKIETPLQRLEHQLHVPVAFLVIPVFALANAGIPIEFTSMADTLGHPVTLGVIIGLVAGKFIGIAGFSWLGLKLGLLRLPEGTSFSQVAGVALLGGIGFTMSIFIAELAFVGQPEQLLMAKTGILVASISAGAAGFIWLRWFARPGQVRQNSEKKTQKTK